MQRMGLENEVFDMKLDKRSEIRDKTIQSGGGSEGFSAKFEFIFETNGCVTGKLGKFRKSP